MVNAGASIEALLKLDATDFDKNINKAIEDLGRFEKSVSKFGADSKKINEALAKLPTIIDQVSNAIGHMNNISNMNKFHTMAEAVNKFANALKILQSDTIDVDQGMNTLNSIFRAYGDTLNGTEVKVKGVIKSLESLTATESKEAVVTDEVTLATKKLALADEEVIALSTRASSVMQTQSASMEKASASMNRASTSARGLGNALSSLRTMGMLVGSMLAYNFIHNLGMATVETVKAKSEMEGYFQMLHFGQGQIDKFNQALDETVKKFPRLNKYALGETISSIGVEFNLTTKEMEKAMPVVSMITSEYIRAGRNVNEASLAVKDILQGEFQRLSRETGVKSEQLKEAGWSGDKNDVMGLLEALEKVGKSRNWDIFVTKANSINDAVMILQNRFGEWSAEMVNTVQPSILRVFNDLMIVGGSASKVLSGVWSWLNGDGLVETAVRWSGIATAIGLVTTALISYRTGANLTQLVQMGLRGTIVATTLGLDAETVATYGSRNAIASRITSIKAETVAEMGVRRAILSKILGLDAEMVAHNGVKGAIMASTFAREVEEAEMVGATATEKAMIVMRQQEELANMSSLKTIFAHITGVNMQTYAQKGLIVALAERIAQSPLYIGSLEAEEVAELSTAEAGFILMGSLLPLIAIFTGLAVAVYSVVKPLQDASAEMESFNNLVDKGDDIIKTHKGTYDSLSKSYEKNKTKLDGLEQGTKKYLRLQDKVTALEKDKNQAYTNWQNSIKAVEMARSRQAKFEEEKNKISIHNQTLLADAYIKAGISSKEANELASHELNQAKKGAEQLREALQMIKLEADKGAEKNSSIIDMLDKYGLSDEAIKKYGTNLSEAQYKIAEGMEKFMTSDNLMDRVMGWLELQQGRLEEWWTEFNAFWEVRDWKSMGDKLQEGLWYVFSSIGIGDALAGLYDSIGDKGLVGTIMDTLFGEGDSDGAWDIISQWANESIIQPLQSWFNWFIEDPSAHLSEIQEDGSVAIAKFFFGKNADGKAMYDIAQDWIDNEVVPSIQDAITDYFSAENILEGGFTFGGVGVLTHDLPKLLFGDDASIKSIIEGKTTELTGVLGQALYNGIKTIPLIGTVLTLFESLTDENIGATEKGSKIGEWLGNGLNEAVNNIPILGQVKQLLEWVYNDSAQNANDSGRRIGTDFSTGMENGLNIDGLVSKFQISSLGLTNTATSTALEVSNSYQGMKNNQKISLDSMVAYNKKSFDDMKNKNNTSLLSMRDSTSQTTHQMSSAWGTMKDSIVSSAKKISDGTTAHFNTLGSNIGNFYRNLQNPANWGKSTASAVARQFGAGHKSWSRTPKPATARRVMGKRGAGVNPYTPSSKKMGIKELVEMVGSDERVDVNQFLALFSGGFGGWDYSSPHISHIKRTAHEWMSAPAVIQGFGSVGNGYKVGRFANGTPSFSFSEFESTASGIFSQIPYKFYYNSDWKGNWLNALLSGAVNCSDGAEALISLARVFGFDGYKQHTTLANGVGHFYAVINGRAMDTTNFQQHGSWSPLGGAGTIPVRHSRGAGAVNTKTVNVSIDMSNTNIYGIDDLENKIEEATKRAMREEFNDPLSGVV